MKRNHYGTGIFLCVVLLLAFFAQCFIKDQAYSALENRTLQTYPSTSLDGLFNGKTTRQLETYSADQFPNRYTWMKWKTKIELMLGMNRIEDVHVGDERLYQEVEPLTMDPLQAESAKAINAFQEAYPLVDMHMMLVPNAIGVYRDEVENCRMDQQQLYDQFYAMLNDQIQKLDTFSLLKEHKEEYLYYKSDHHWTSLAASYAASDFLQEDLSYQVVMSNEQFQGTLAKKIAYDQFIDQISLFLLDNDPTYVVTYDQDKKTTSVYDAEKQFDQDAYGIFFGGNHPYLSINTNVAQDKRLLLLKDSYANCLIPFLLPYYSEIVVIDPRYYFEDIDQIMVDHDINEVLFLYNINTFFTDHSLYELLSNRE